MRHEQLENCIRKIDDIYFELEASEDPVIRSLLIYHTKRARFLTIFNAVSLVVAIGGFITSLLERKLMFHLWLPGIDVQATPTFEILYITEVSRKLFITKIMKWIIA